MGDFHAFPFAELGRKREPTDPAVHGWRARTKTKETPKINGTKTRRGTRWFQPANAPIASEHIYFPTVSPTPHDLSNVILRRALSSPLKKAELAPRTRRRGRDRVKNGLIQAVFNPFDRSRRGSRRQGGLFQRAARPAGRRKRGQVAERAAGNRAGQYGGRSAPGLKRRTDGQGMRRGRRRKCPLRRFRSRGGVLWRLRRQGRRHGIACQGFQHAGKREGVCRHACRRDTRGLAVRRRSTAARIASRLSFNRTDGFTSKPSGAGQPPYATHAFGGGIRCLRLHYTPACRTNQSAFTPRAHGKKVFFNHVPKGLTSTPFYSLEEPVPALWWAGTGIHDCRKPRILRQPPLPAR